MSNSSQLTVEHSGNHHQASLLVDSNSKTLTGGAIFNYSQNASVGLQINETGKVSGTFVHSGNTHSLQAVIKSDGQFEGTYRDNQANVAISMKSGVASLSEGTLPQMGLNVQGNHHAASLGLDTEGNLNGTLEAKSTDNTTYQLKINKGEVTGSFVHQGEHHKTSILLNKEGWQADLAISCKDQQYAIAVKQGQSDLRITGNVQLTF